MTACAYFAGSINSSVEVETIGSNHRRTWRDLSPSARFSSNIAYLQSLRCVEVTIIGAYAGALLRLLESATPPNRIDWEGWDIPFGHVHDLDLEIWAHVNEVPLEAQLAYLYAAHLVLHQPMEALTRG
jgi:hypothetical protein